MLLMAQLMSATVGRNPKHQVFRDSITVHLPADPEQRCGVEKLGLRKPSILPAWVSSRNRLCVVKEPCRLNNCVEHLRIETRGKVWQEAQLTADVEALDRLVRQGSYVNYSVLYDVLKKCISIKDLILGTRVHAIASKSGYSSNAFLANHIICMYASHGRLQEAMLVFSKVTAPNRYVWASIIMSHARHGQPRDAVKLYRQMRKTSVEPDNHIYVAVLKACASAEDLPAGKEVHADIMATADKPSLFVGTCLVDMYSKCGSLDEARRVFDNLPTRDVVTWTAMIAGYAQHGLGQEALALYEHMQQEGITPADAVTFVCLLQACRTVGALQQLHAQIQRRGFETDVVVSNCLVSMYVKCGSLEDACRLFDRLRSKDVVTWTAMIAGYAQHGLGQEALNLYGSMQQEGITPADAVTFVCLLQACGSVSGLDKGKEIHGQISTVGLDATDLFVANALIDMYGKCGSMIDAQRMFDALPTRDVVTCNTLIAGYARQGESEPVFKLLHRIRQDGIQPDGITFLGILAVCSHACLVNEGHNYFQAMTRDYGINPTIEHYTCMVDLLARSGHIQSAIRMLKLMPYEPHAELWRCVLGACRKWNIVELGRHAFECAVILDKDDAAAYLLMASIYADANMHEERKEIQAMRRKAHARKNPGQSWWTNIDGTTHSFVVEDRDHLKQEQVYAELGDIFVKLKEEGSALRFQDEAERV